MIGLDTNVVIRILTRDDLKQSATAKQAIDAALAAGDSVYLTAVVVCETVWVLRAVYRYTRAEIAAAIDLILRMTQLDVEDRSLMWQALSDYQNGKADFADYLIGRLARQRGCTRTLTFDASLKGNELFDVL